MGAALQKVEDLSSLLTLLVRTLHAEHVGIIDACVLDLTNSLRRQQFFGLV